MIQQFFTQEGVSNILVALILYLAAKPLVQGASRLTELLIHLFGTGHNPKRRNMVISAEFAPGYQDLVADTVIREPLLPGVLLFSFAYFNNSQTLTGTSEMTAGQMAAISISLFLFFLFRIMASLKRSATRSSLPVAHTISAIACLSACVLALTSGLSLESICAALIASIFFAQSVTLIARGVRNYGLFSIFWIPVGAFSWLCRVFALTIAAPLIAPLLIVEQLFDLPLVKRRSDKQTMASAKL